MNRELKPCPFCGSKDIKIGELDGGDYAGGSYFGCCDDCGSEGPMVYWVKNWQAAEAEATRLWNDRRQEDE